jgi:hypothetical protein
MRVIEERQEPAAAAVGRAEQDGTVGSAHVLGLDEREVGRVLDASGGVRRRMLDIDDDLIGGVVGIGLEINHADVLLVGAREPESASAQHVGMLLDLDARDLGRGRGDEQDG